MEHHEMDTNSPKGFNRWGDRSPINRPEMMYDDPSFRGINDRQRSSRHYDNMRSNNHDTWHHEMANDRIDPYRRPMPDQELHSEYDQFDQEEMNMNHREYYGGGNVIHDDTSYSIEERNFRPQQNRYDNETDSRIENTYDEDSVGSPVYDRGAGEGPVFGRDPFGDNLYASIETPDVERYGRGAIGGDVYGEDTFGDHAHRRDIAPGGGFARRTYDRGVIDTRYKRSGFAGEEYQPHVGRGGGYDTRMIDAGNNGHIIIDDDIDTGSAKGAEYDRAIYEQQKRDHERSFREWGNEYDNAAMVSSRRLNRRRQSMLSAQLTPQLTPVTIPTAPIPMMISHPKNNDDFAMAPTRYNRQSPSTKSSERKRRTSSGADEFVSSRDMLRNTRRSPSTRSLERTRGHVPRTDFPQIGQDRKLAQQEKNNVFETAIRDDKKYVKPIEVLEFRPTPPPELDDNTFRLRETVPPRKPKPQVSESSTSDDSDSSEDSQSSSQISSSSSGSETDSSSEESRSKYRRDKKGRKDRKRSKKKNHVRKEESNDYDTESEESPKSDMNDKVNTFLTYFGVEPDNPSETKEYESKVC